MTFGSVNRGDSDEHSDIDLLIATPNDKDFDHSVYDNFANDEKYSISYYNYPKLEFISDSGNLFIQHLKQHGKILHDDNNKLSNILHRYSPLNSYQKELTRALKFKLIFQKMPKTEISNGWVCDLLYIAVRNVLVLKSAEEKEYMFGYKSLLKRYQQEYLLTNQDIFNLNNLRITKQKYRNNLHFIKTDSKSLNAIFASSEKILGKINREFVDFGDYFTYVRQLIVNDKIDVYRKLRSLEGLYNSNGTRIAELTKIFSKPQFYVHRAKKETNLELWLNIIRDSNRHSTLENTK